MATEAVFVAHYARGLRRRAVVLLLTRAGLAALGAGLVALAFAAIGTGPVATAGHARSVFAAVAVLALAVLWLGARPVRELRGAGICRLVQPVAPELASHLRSALELAVEREAHASDALVAAHARVVAARLTAVPRERVVGWRWLRHRAVALGVLGVLASTLALTQGPGASGLRALLVPATVTTDGVRVTSVITRLEANLVFPSYLDRAPARLADWSELAAPRGTTVELRVHARLPSRHGTLRIGKTAFPLTPGADGLAASFVVRENAPLAIEIESEGHRYADEHPRRVRAIADTPPTITLLAPATDLRLRGEDAFVMRYRAGDDVGLATIEFVRRVSGGAETRRRLWSPTAGQPPGTSIEAALTTTPAEEGARDGDLLTVWLEALDGDIVSGPKRAVSRAITIEVTGRDRRAAIEAPRLRALLDQGLGVLGDRLEAPVPDVPADAAQRSETLRAKTESWLADVEIFASEVADLRTGDRVRDIVVRTRRLLDRERAAHRASAPHADVLADDARLVDAHERDVVLLADLLGDALVGEARDLSNDLAEAAAEMRRLIDELRATADEAAKHALLDEIARAERRLMDLARSLADMSTRVPSDFVNREAVERGSSRTALESLRDAVQAGDMESALDRLDALAREFDEIARQIESGKGRYRNARFGSEDAAFAQARSQLDSLAAAQEQLAQRSGDMLRRLGERAGRGTLDEAQRSEMQAQAEAIERDLQRVPDGALGDADARSLDQARQRARDTTDALRAGDLGEARRSAARTGTNLDRLAPEMRGQAGMFPGHEGETARGAEAVDSAVAKLGDLRRQLEGAAPSADAQAGQQERAQMQADARTQGELQASAEALQRSFGGNPGGSGEPMPNKSDPTPGQTSGHTPSQDPGQTPGQTPGQALSPTAAQALEGIGQRMAQARDALQEGRADDAALAQEDAGRRLRELGKQLDGKGKADASGQSGEPGGPSQGQHGKREGGDGGHVEGPVRIPDADEFRGPEALRRRLLDAMREGSPPGYEQAVRRYYEELLR